MANSGPAPSSDAPAWARQLVGLGASLGVGLLPGAPGTYGSLLCLGLAWLWLHLGGGPLAGAGFAWFLVGLACLALAFSQSALNLGLFGGKPDPGQVVIDEALGQMLAMWGVAAPGWEMLAGFALFRALDILKPWPVGWSQRLPGAWGIVMDDALAGLLAWLGVQFLALLLACLA